MGAQVATPSAVALNELLQNAVEHAFVAHSDELQPEVHVSFDRQGDELSVQVRDNGTGLPGGLLDRQDHEPWSFDSPRVRSRASWVARSGCTTPAGLSLN